MFDRFERILRQRSEQPGTPPPATRPETLAPGDALILQDGRDFLVQVAIDCQEDQDGRTTAWRWLLLDDGGLLEVQHRDLNLYDAPEILRQGMPAFALLTGQGEQEGLLRVFEARAHAGTIAGAPVTYQHGAATYQIQSTGTFAARFNGTTDAGVWTDVSDKSGDNVYVRMESDTGSPALGIWTTHIALYTGGALTHADIKGMYSR
jgi:hypothetical protein